MSHTPDDFIDNEQQDWQHMAETGVRMRPSTRQALSEKERLAYTTSKLLQQQQRLRAQHQALLALQQRLEQQHEKLFRSSQYAAR